MTSLNIKNYTYTFIIYKESSNVANYAWENVHNINFEVGKISGTGNFRTRKTFESWRASLVRKSAPQTIQQQTMQTITTSYLRSNNLLIHSRFPCNTAFALMTASFLPVKNHSKMVETSCKDVPVLYAGNWEEILLIHLPLQKIINRQRGNTHTLVLFAVNER